MNPIDPKLGSQSGSDAKQPARRAGLLQVAKTLVFGLLAIGLKGTWNKDGVQVTTGQIVTGAIVAGVLLILVLIVTVRVVLKLATA